MQKLNYSEIKHSGRMPDHSYDYSGVSGEFEKQIKNCLRCDVYKTVAAKERDSEFVFSAPRLRMLKSVQIEKTSQSVPQYKGSGVFDAFVLTEFAHKVKK